MYNLFIGLLVMIVLIVLNIFPLFIYTFTTSVALLKIITLLKMLSPVIFSKLWVSWKRCNIISCLQPSAKVLYKHNLKIVPVCKFLLPGSAFAIKNKDTTELDVSLIAHEVCISAGLIDEMSDMLTAFTIIAKARPILIDNLAVRLITLLHLVLLLLGSLLFVTLFVFCLLITYSIIFDVPLLIKM